MLNRKLIVVTGAVALVQTTAVAADIGSDLKATIVLQGLPCDQVKQQARNADSDYTVTCKDGNRYHVFVNAQGRVVVQKAQ